MMKPAIKNTTTAMADYDEREVFLARSMFGGKPIEESEARGQAELVRSEQLPTECNPEDRTALEKAGVVFGPPTPGDEIFCSATLPAGWKKVGTNHDMWSDLVDDKGRKRAAIFYKAAFYDRSAHINAVRRFSVTAKSEDHCKTSSYVVLDGDVVLYETATLPFSDARPLRVEADAWLASARPDWKDASAYWDEP